MKLGEATVDDEMYAARVQGIYNTLLQIVTECPINSPEWNYGWDMLRNHVDHFKYKEMERCNRPQMAIPQPPLEVPCCN